MIPKLPISETLRKANQKPFLELADRFFRESKIHHALLLSGIEGVGKRELALWFTQLLFCDSPIGNQPCQQCPSCKRAQNGNWVDFIYVEPEEKKERVGAIKIEAIREIKKQLGFGPSEEPLRVVLISQADRLNTEASNTLLKMLEEPPPRWQFILTTNDAQNLLPTLYSRCSEIRFHPLTRNQTLEALRETQENQIDPRLATFAAAIGMGSLSRALQFTDDTSMNIRARLLGLLSAPGTELTKLSDEVSGSPQKMSILIDLIQTLLYDLVQEAINPKAHEWVHADQKDFLMQWYEQKRIQPGKILHALGKLEKTRSQLELTLNNKILTQQIFAPLLELYL